MDSHMWECVHIPSGLTQPTRHSGQGSQVHPRLSQSDSLCPTQKPLGPLHTWSSTIYKLRVSLANYRSSDHSRPLLCRPPSSCNLLSWVQWMEGIRRNGCPSERGTNHVVEMRAEKETSRLDHLPSTGRVTLPSVFRFFISESQQQGVLKTHSMET